jgi:hypothetical protein
MAKKIAKIDADNMNSLYASEMERMGGVKVAVDARDGKEEVGGISHDPQDFKDHDEYLETLQSVLKDDGSEDFDPNDTKLD